MPLNGQLGISEAIEGRHSVRQFRPDPVPSQTIRHILELAAHAPSGGNLQPWRVYALAGEPLAALKEKVRSRDAEQPEHKVYPESLWEPYRSRRYKNGEELYATIGIGREERPKRLEQLARNGSLFDAPVGLFFFIDRKMGPVQWADLGMFMQNVMLASLCHGLGTCAQGYWVRYPNIVASAVGAPQDELILVSGMALGAPDETALINRYKAGRDHFFVWAEMQGFDEI